MVSKDLPKHECSVFDVWRNKRRKEKLTGGKQRIPRFFGGGVISMTL